MTLHLLNSFRPILYYGPYVIQARGLPINTVSHNESKEGQVQLFQVAYGEEIWIEYSSFFVSVSFSLAVSNLRRAGPSR